MSDQQQPATKNRFSDVAMLLMPAAMYAALLGDDLKTACITSYLFGRCGKDETTELKDFCKRFKIGEMPDVDLEHNMELFVDKAMEILREEDGNAAAALSQVLTDCAVEAPRTSSPAADDEAFEKGETNVQSYYTEKTKRRKFEHTTRLVAMPKNMTSMEGAIWRGGVLVGSLTSVAVGGVGFAAGRQLWRWLSK